MAYFFFLLAFVCSLYSKITLGLVNTSSEVILSRRMDVEAAIEITNIFQRNADMEFSWNDAGLSKLLSRALLDGTSFGARIPKNGALLTFPQCIGCADDASTEGWTLDKFTVDFFLKAKIIDDRYLKDTCVFYTQRTRPNMVPDGLSRPATRWACIKGLKTIWQMWPYNTETDDGNYWIMYENQRDGPKNWLYNVWEADQDWHTVHVFNNQQKLQGPINTFFSYMSWAMAASCSGIAYVMTDDPKNFPPGGIWPLIELPALRTGASGPNGVTRIIAVPFNSEESAFQTTNDQDLWLTMDLSAGATVFSRDMEDLNQLNWTSYLDENGNPPPDTISSFKEKAEKQFQNRMRDIHQDHDLQRRGLNERDSCLGGQPYEAPGHDYFGYGN